MGRLEIVSFHERFSPSLTALRTATLSPHSSPRLPAPQFQTSFGRYDVRLRQLAALRRKLHTALPDENFELVPTPEPESVPLLTFRTCFGELSFDDLYQRTRRYTAAILHHTYQMDPADVNDGLQAGYLKLWQRLQQQSDLLEGKSLAWIGKFIAYAALHATRGDWQFKRKAAVQEDEERQRNETAKMGRQTHSRETRRTDTRLDLQAAIAACAGEIMAQPVSKQQTYDLWALYGLTMLHEFAAETSRLFAVREQSMQVAYTHVRGLLQQRLRDYAPHQPTTPVHGKGQKKLPFQDVSAIRKANGTPSSAQLEAVRAKIGATKADTMILDLLALQGIQQGVTIQVQAHASNIAFSRMRRAYARVHLLLAAERDPEVRTRRPTKRTIQVFTLTPETELAVEQLALELLKHPRSTEKLIALHTHISNLPVSTTAKNFNLPTSTLRYDVKQIGQRLRTPTYSVVDINPSKLISTSE
jgi:hypothetical protein